MLFQLSLYKYIYSLWLRNNMLYLKNKQGYLCQLHFEVIHCFKAMYLLFRKYDLHEYLLMDMILTKYTQYHFNKLPCNKYIKL